MKIRLNKETVVEVHESTVEMILEDKKVSCWQVKCLDKEIYCGDCCFKNKPRLDLDKVLVEV